MSLCLRWTREVEGNPDSKETISWCAGVGWVPSFLTIILLDPMEIQTMLLVRTEHHRRDLNTSVILSGRAAVFTLQNKSHEQSL